MNSRAAVAVCGHIHDAQIDAQDVPGGTGFGHGHVGGGVQIPLAGVLVLEEVQLPLQTPH
jgi:hypothetical protein